MRVGDKLSSIKSRILICGASALLLICSGQYVMSSPSLFEEILNAHGGRPEYCMHTKMDYGDCIVGHHNHLTKPEMIEALDISTEIGMHFCRSEKAIWQDRKAVVKTAGLTAIPSNECTKVLQKMPLASRPEIIIAFENHDNPNGEEPRRGLTNEALNGKLMLVTEYLSHGSEPLEMARYLNHYRVPIRQTLDPKSGAVELQVSGAQQKIRGLDDPRFIAVYRLNETILQMNRLSHTPKKEQTKLRYSTEDRFKDFLLANPEFAKMLDGLAMHIEEVPSQVAKLPPALPMNQAELKNLTELWTKPENTDARRKVQLLAFALLNIRGMANNVPGFWKANLSELDGNSQPSDRFEAFSDDTFRMLAETLLIESINQLNSRYKDPVTAESVHMVMRDFAFTQNIVRAYCDAVKMGYKTVVVNQGNGHTGRDRILLDEAFHSQVKMRNLDINNSFSMTKVYDHYSSDPVPEATEKECEGDRLNSPATQSGALH
jgi:hypothetical protein